MADISKCSNGETCCLRLDCYRYLITPHLRQSYFAPPEPGKDCEYFIQVTKSDMNLLNRDYPESADANE